MKKNIFFLILIIMTIGILAAGCGTEDTSQEEEDILVDGDEINSEVKDDEKLDLDEDANHNHDHEVEEGMAPDLFYHTADGGHAYLKNLQGKEVSLEDYRGKIIFLNFWATWCQYCNQQMPDVQRVHEEHDDVVVLAVDVKESQAKVEEYLEEGGYTFEVLLDTTGEVSQTYFVSGFPTTYVIREDGSISRFFSGMLTYEMMEDMLEIARSGE